MRDIIKRIHAIKMCSTRLRYFWAHRPIYHNSLTECFDALYLSHTSSFFRFSCSDLSLSCLSHRLFTRDSFKCSTYTHFGRRALALTQNTSSRQSAFFLTNHIKIYTRKPKHTHTKRKQQQQ